MMEEEINLLGKNTKKKKKMGREIPHV